MIDVTTSLPPLSARNLVGCNAHLGVGMGAEVGDRRLRHAVEFVDLARPERLGAEKVPRRLLLGAAAGFLASKALNARFRLFRLLLLHEP